MFMRFPLVGKLIAKIGLVLLIKQRAKLKVTFPLEGSISKGLITVVSKPAELPTSLVTEQAGLPSGKKPRQ